MSSFYQCARCNYKTKKHIDITRHLDRKIKCKRSVESLSMSDEEIYT